MATKTAPSAPGSRPFRLPDRKVETIAELLTFLREDREGLDSDLLLGRAFSRTAPVQGIPVWFRGLPDAAWNLKTTMSLHNALDNEQALMNRFRQDAPQFLERLPTHHWEWLFLARHHGLPSRLLDWTEHPLVGLYFAVTPDRGPEDSADGAEGALWCLLPSSLNLTTPLFKTNPLELPMLSEFEPSASQYLTDAVSGPNPPNYPPVAGIAMRDTKRMQTQRGVFTMNNRVDTAIDLVDSGKHVWRFIIPGIAKADIRRDLFLLGITRLSVYPELDNVALMAKRFILNA